jgi:2-C-methyl-D-erythritol 4-phosphate cytidylyltransferase/2-C-methyl-D-erythritol 2,4-cyclodiphosphate synthase
MNIWIILLAAGEGSRLKEYLNTKKQFFVWKNRPIFWHSAKTFNNIPILKGIIFVVPPEEKDLSHQISHLALKDHFSLPYKVIKGGKTRQESVFNGLNSLPSECSHVLIHDSVRPFVTPSLVNRVISLLKDGEKAVVPGVGVTDTIKLIKDGEVVTLPRERLKAVQTPQGFEKNTIVAAHNFAIKNNILGTDDASLVELMGGKVAIVDGEYENIKITHPQDLKFLINKQEEFFVNCIGFGYDVHRYGEGRPLKLGGVLIPKAPSIVAHSDGDVVVHSLIDAILGCLAEGDIGDFFPDTDPKYRGMNSLIFLSEVMNLAQQRGLIIEHVDITIICEIPKISPYKREMKKNLAHILNISLDQINISATTEEGLGFTGEKKGIKVKSIVLAKKKKK